MKMSKYDLRIPEKRFRPELEGVRAVAALLVAIYHIWFGTVSGGVDVFFVVSGYLITTSVLSKYESERAFNYFNYLLNICKRLFPNAFLVLLVTAFGSFFLLPKVKWDQVISEIYASAFYVENWQLARNAVDYLAQNNEASPLQHFWALSIQGQFYVTWPLVIFLAFLLARKLFKTPLRKTLLVVLLTIFSASLAYSIYKTNVNQPWAYFDTFARVWEFSLGGILALLLPYLKPNKAWSFVMSWIGLAIICLTGILLPVSTVFPGYAALLPISGVILIIIAAENRSFFGGDALITSKPFMFFGSISYGFYLWHWPLLIFYFAFFKTNTVPLVDGLIILLITFVLSFLSTKMFEAPIRNMSLATSKKKMLATLMALFVAVIVVNTSWTAYHEHEEQQFQQQVNLEDYPGARVLFENIEATQGVKPIVLVDESERLPTFYRDNCYVDMNSSGLKKCSYGETNEPKYIVAVVGGSRDGHWFPALEPFAEELRIQIDVYNKDACRFSTDDFDGLLSDTCIEWNELVLEHLLEDPPDLIFTTANVSEAHYGSSIPVGYLEIFEKFEGITKIFAIRNNPSMPFDIPACVEEKGAEECKVLRKDVLSETPPWEITENLPSNIYFADLSDYLCDEEYCHAVIGNLIIYRDRYHLSTLYVSTLAEPMKQHMIQALEDIPPRF